MTNKNGVLAGPVRGRWGHSLFAACIALSLLSLVPFPGVGSELSGQPVTESSATSYTAREVNSLAESQSAESETPKRPRGELEEVVVTARKRTENAEDVPLSIAVVSADEIAARQLVNAADYLRDIPGVNQVEGGYGGQAIVVRGIASDTSFQNYSGGATTASYFGETPISSTAGLLGSSVDTNLVDIERVEVLRGPQGTSFGDTSLGGAVRIVPVAPKLDQFTGRVGAGYSVTSGTGGRNYTFQGVLNIPLLQDRLAIRAVAYEFSDSGYYRNVAASDAAFQAQVVAPYGAQAFAINQEQVGATNTEGGRIAGLFQASDNLKFTLSYLTQRTEQSGWPVSTTATPYEGTVLQVAPEHVFSGQSAGTYTSLINLGNAIGEYNLGWASILGTYSYITSGTANAIPYSFIGIPWPISFDALPTLSHREQVGEVRLVTRLKGAWNFVGGLYFDKQDDEDHRTAYWYGDPATDFFAPGERFIGDYTNPRDLKQRAAFGEVTWELFPGLTILGGARYYKYDRAAQTQTSGAFFGIESSNDSTTASGTVGRASLSYKLNPDSLVYAEWAQGFRLGSVQPPLSASSCFCSTDGVHINGTNVTLASTAILRSDSTNSYELGAKFSLFNRHLALDADLFLTDWTDIPLSLLAGAYSTYVSNAGNARSKGVEFQAKYQVTDALRVDFGGSWLDAQLTRVAQNVTGGAVGDRLPGSPKVNSNLSVQYAFTVEGQAAFLRADAMYVGSFYGDVPESPNLKAGGYATVNTTIRVPLRSLNLDLYAHNLTNRDSYTYRGSFTFVGDNYGFRLRPRTIGFQLDYPF